MTQEERQNLINALGMYVAEQVKLTLEPVKKQLDRLELRFDQAELRVREYRFAGVWTDRATYMRGNTVQHGGSTWHCNIDNCGTMPSADHVGWTLQAKRGADAPGARS